jgi:hypothetical protein
VLNPTNRQEFIAESENILIACDPEKKKILKLSIDLKRFFSEFLDTVRSL